MKVSKAINILEAIYNDKTKVNEIDDADWLATCMMASGALHMLVDFGMVVDTE